MVFYINSGYNGNMRNEVFDVGARIVQLRKNKNITTNKLANMAGISQSFLRDIELGNKNPTVETLSYICSALDVSLQYFFSQSDNSALQPFLLSALHDLNEQEQLKLAEFISVIKN